MRNKIDRNYSIVHIDHDHLYSDWSNNKRYLTLKKIQFNKIIATHFTRTRKNENKCTNADREKKLQILLVFFLSFLSYVIQTDSFKNGTIQESNSLITFSKIPYQLTKCIYTRISNSIPHFECNSSGISFLLLLFFKTICLSVRWTR